MGDISATGQQVHAGSPEAAAARAAAAPPRPGLAAADWRDYVALLKPRVMTLVVFTGACGLVAAPGNVPFFIALVAILCIAVGAGAAAAFNQWWEADTDAMMRRTAHRPLPSGRLQRDEALAFAVVLAGAAVVTLALATNWVAAAWLAFSIFFYSVVYTIWLKPRTPQNIVIGGAAGAFPPVIGWAAVTGDVTTLPLLLFAIIFAWTPPHFWALALFVRGDYARAGIPMLPVTHGIGETRRQILLYSFILAAISIAPWVAGLTGAIYGIVALTFSALFLLLAIRVARSRETDPRSMRAERQLFRFSILYLFLLFAALVGDVLL